VVFSLPVAKVQAQSGTCPIVDSGEMRRRTSVHVGVGRNIPLAVVMATDALYGVDYNPAWRNEAAKAGKISFDARREGKVQNDHRIDWADAYFATAPEGAGRGAARTTTVNSGNAIFLGAPLIAMKASLSSITCARVRASECSSGWYCVPRG
jgi:hypothetical protein